MLRKLSLLLALTAASLAQTAKNSKTKTPPPATKSQSIVLRGGKLLTITHGVIENGVLVMQNGKSLPWAPPALFPFPTMPSWWT